MSLPSQTDKINLDFFAEQSEIAKLRAIKKPYSEADCVEIKNLLSKRWDKIKTTPGAYCYKPTSKDNAFAIQVAKDVTSKLNELDPTKKIHYYSLLMPSIKNFNDPVTMDELSEKDWREFILSDDGDYWIDVAAALESGEVDGKYKYTFEVDGQYKNRELSDSERTRLIDRSTYTKRYYEACQRKLNYVDPEHLSVAVKKMIAGLRDGGASELGAEKVAAAGATEAILAFQQFVDAALADGRVSMDTLTKLFAKKAPRSKYSFGDHWFAFTLYPEWVASVRLALRKAFVKSLKEALTASGVEGDSVLKKILDHRVEKTIKVKKRQADGTILETPKTVMVNVFDAHFQTLAEKILRESIKPQPASLSSATGLAITLLKALTTHLKPLPATLNPQMVVNTAMKSAIDYAKTVGVAEEACQLNKLANKTQVINAVGGLGMMCAELAANYFEKIVEMLGSERSDIKSLQQDINYGKGCMQIHLGLATVATQAELLALFKGKPTSSQAKMFESYAKAIKPMMKIADKDAFIALLKAFGAKTILLVLPLLSEDEFMPLVKTDADLADIFQAMFPEGKDLSKFELILREKYYEFNVRAYLSVRLQDQMEISKKAKVLTFFGCSGYKKSEKIAAARALLAWLTCFVREKKKLVDMSAQMPALLNGRLKPIFEEISDDLELVVGGIRLPEFPPVDLEMISAMLLTRSPAFPALITLRPTVLNLLSLNGAGQEALNASLFASGLPVTLDDEGSGVDFLESLQHFSLASPSDQTPG